MNILRKFKNKRKIAYYWQDTKVILIILMILQLPDKVM